MKVFYTLTTMAFVGLFSLYSNAQNLENGDLEGEITGVSNIPNGWQAIPFTDMICRANEPYKATPDLTNADGVPSSVTISGTAHSGETFISALDFGPGWHHEGIQQRVTGLIPGQVYQITFYQAVIKQENALDTSGSWAVYMDNGMIDISSVSTSLDSYESVETKWDKRTIQFKAKSESHLLKFIPVDDDNVYNHDSQDGNLRMGIDDISIEEVVDGEIVDELDMLVYPNPTLDQFTVQTDLEKYTMTIIDAAGRIILQQQNCSYNTPVELDQRGVFLVKIQTETQFAVRRVIIQ